MDLWWDRVLILAPHADDETLGCGGLIQHVLASGGACHVWIATIGHEAQARGEQTTDEMDAAMCRLGVCNVTVAYTGYQSRLADVGVHRIVGDLDAEIASMRPTAVFAPYASHHQDHRTLYEATVAAMRPRVATLGVKLFALYEYPYAAAWPAPEIPGGKFYLPLSGEQLETKLNALRAYKTQFERPGAWCSVEHVASWARQRGHEVGREAAEAFWVVRGLLA